MTLAGGDVDDADGYLRAIHGVLAKSRGGQERFVKTLTAERARMPQSKGVAMRTA